MRAVILVAIMVAGFLFNGCGVFRPFRENIAVLQDRATQEDFDSWADSMRGANEFDTALNMTRWASKNMTYVADGPIDYPRDYLVTFKRLSGDCDDYSSMFMAAMHRAGFSAEMLSVWHPGGGHSVCVFKHAGAFYHISNWGDSPFGGVATIRLLAATVYSDWSSFILRNFDMEELERGSR